MNAPAKCDNPHSRRANLYGAFAFASVIITCFSGYFFTTTFYGSEEMVVLTFLLGVAYSIMGVLGSSYIEGRGPTARFVYFVVQCAIVTPLVMLSPLRGFMGIVVLPLIAEGIFELRPRNAVLVAAYLIFICIGVWGFDFGWVSAFRALSNYAAAFAFTIVFSIITKQALKAREQSEKLRHELEEANTLLRAHASQAEDLATTRERNRVAREIHDGVGHYLTVVKTQLDAAAALLPANPDKARDAVVKAAKLSGDALDDVRRSVGTLRTDAARPPLPEALHTLTHEAGLPVTLKIEGSPRALPPGIEHALFRSAQEGLTNIRKHSDATASEVALHFREDGRVTLTVADNGRGASDTSTSGFGLLGIRERIEVLGGRVASGNRSTGGFSLSVEVPA